MKCPQCDVRNSVAATQCKDCGTKFPREGFKGIPKPFLFGAVGLIAVAGLGVAALSIVPAAFDPEANLQKIVKRVAVGPKSGSDAEHIKAELEGTAKDFLEKNSKQSTAELTATLQKIFPNSAFEVRVFDLPNNLRLVEIDTMLQATDYLMSGKHVTVLRNFEVFETAKVINDPAGNVITLLGHRNAQAGRQPQVRVFALLPDGVADRTQDSVPPISGDGTAAFATNGKDINLDMSILSKAGEERLFTIDSLSRGTLVDETVKSRLTLKNGKYDLTEDPGRSAAACLRAIAFVLTDSSAKDRFRHYFSDSAIGAVAGLGKLKVNPPLFTLKKMGGTASGAAGASTGTAGGSGDNSGGHSRRSRRHRHHHDDDDGSGQASGGALTYLLNNAQDAFEVSMARSDGHYVVTSIKRVNATSESPEAVVQAPAASPDASSTASTAVTTSTDAGKNDKVITKVDEFGSKKIVGNDGASVTKESDKEKNDVKISDKVQMAILPPSSAGAGSSDNHTQITAKVTEKKAGAESGAILKSLNIATIKVRDGASTQFRPIGELRRGQAVQIIGKKDGWYKVQLDGREGYVYGGFVDCKTGDAYTTATVRRGRNVRNESGQKIGEALAGDRLVVIGPGKNGKYEVKLSNGLSGLISKDAIDVSADVTASAQPAEVKVEPRGERAVEKPVERRHAIKTIEQSPVKQAETRSSRHSESRSSRHSESQSSKPIESSSSRSGRHSSESSDRHSSRSSDRSSEVSSGRHSRHSDRHSESHTFKPAEAPAASTPAASSTSGTSRSSRHSRHGRGHSSDSGSSSSKPAVLPEEQPQFVP